MTTIESQQEYERAHKAAIKEHKRCIAAGEPGNVQVLDDIFPENNSAAREDLGLLEIPSGLIAGTKTNGRQYALTPSFLPLLELGSEFSVKWVHLCHAHMSDEGIHDPIKCFEYYGRFYVLEGNKRVSVLRYFGAPTVPAHVIRLQPADTDSPRYARYREFLEFFQLSRLYRVQFSLPGSYRKLLSVLGWKETWSAEQRQRFSALFTRFCDALPGTVFLQNLTEADALLLFLRYHTFADLREMSGSALKSAIAALQADINALGKPDPVAVSTEPTQRSRPVSRLLAPLRGKLRIAFIHERDIETSNWTHAHEDGRAYVSQLFPNQVETRAYFNAQPGENTEALIDRAVKDGANVIFTTTPLLMGATLRACPRHPNVKLLNCSVDMPYPDVRTYYARVFEGKFITGAIAGAMTHDGRIGYIGSSPTFGVPASINAFALGARMTNPDARIHLLWSCQRSDYLEEFRRQGIRIVSNRDVPLMRGDTMEYGTFILQPDGGIKPLGSPVWNWGKLYSRIVQSILDGTWDDDRHMAQNRAVNYWWGMRSGVIDLRLSDDLPEGVRCLAEILRQQIQSGQLDPFARKLIAQDGTCKNPNGLAPDMEAILHMDYLLEMVDGSIPTYDDLLPMAKKLVKLQGVYRDSLSPETEGVLL